MIHRFASFELDPEARTLSNDGVRVELQPQAFDVLAYLVRHRARVVPKRELLDALWPDVVVTEASIERAVSLARAALGPLGKSAIETLPRRGYRFVAPLAPDRDEAEAVRYARADDVHVAYRVVGEGPIDIVVVGGWVLPMDALLGHPAYRAAIEAVARLGRVILFDKRGTGASDRVKRTPTLEERAQDLRAVLDAARSTSAVILGFSEGGPLAIHFAATHPARTRGLLLVGAFARMTRTRGYDVGWDDADVERLRTYVRDAWGRGATARATLGAHEDSEATRAWARAAELAGASPGAALDLLEMNLAADVRALLPAIEAPTRILHRVDDRVIPVACGRYLAAHVRGATYAEHEGDDHLFVARGRDVLVASVRALLASPRPPGRPRFVGAVLACSEAETLASLSPVYGGRPLDDVAVFDTVTDARTCARALVLGAPNARSGLLAAELPHGGPLDPALVAEALALVDAAAPGEVALSEGARALLGER